MPSLYKQITNPRATYTDGYGVTREVYEPKWVTYTRKGYNLLDRFLNGPSEEEYRSIGLEKPLEGLGIAELVNPEGALQVGKTSQSFKNPTSWEVAKRYIQNGKLNKENIVSDINRGRKDAISYLASDVKKETDLHNIELGNRIGIKIQPQENPERIASSKMHPSTNNPAEEVLHADVDVILDHKSPKVNELFTAGRTNYGQLPEYDKVTLNHWLDLDDSAFHEFLHRGGIGSASRTSSAELANSTNDFYKWKGNKLLKDSANEYVSDPKELGATLLEVGRRYGITPNEPYPGKEVAETVFKTIQNDPVNKDFLSHIKFKEKPKRVWDALSGKYFAVPLIAASVISNDE